MKRWLDPTPVTVPPDVKNAVGGHPLIAKRMVRQGITSADAARAFIDPSAYQRAPVHDLPDIERAVSRLRRAIEAGEMILIWGDFDVDGQTSTAVLVDGLQHLNARVTYHIPGRFSEGHGIRADVLAQVLDETGATVLLTCDTGVAAFEAIDYANAHDVDVIVTDHHALPDTLPDAHAVVNPMRLAEDHPMRNLSGVGVAYALMEALHNQPVEPLLDLMALGLVADVMVQRADTRYYIQRGLNVMRDTQRAGLQEIMRLARVEPEHLTEEHIGFAIAPRLNALGRLGDKRVNDAVELLTGDSPGALANELEGLNRERRALTNQIYAAAKAMIETDPTHLKYAALVLAREGWHTGVVGIVANRLAEDYDRPAMLLAITGEHASGSARSVDGCDITEAIKSQAHLLDGFGGHVMAAGLRLPVANLEKFRRGLSGVVRKMLAERAEDEPQLPIDAYISLSDVTLELAYDIARLAPFGNGNPPLTLAVRGVSVRSKRTLGRGDEHIQLVVEDDSGASARVIWWGATLDDVPEGRFDLAFTLRVDTYGDEPRPVAEWIDMRPTATPQPVAVSAPPVTVVDYRGEENPAESLAALRAEQPDAVTWAEPPLDGTKRRYELTKADALILWSTPPSRDVERAVIDTVQPRTIYLFGAAERYDTPEAFMRRLTGIVKTVLNRMNGVSELTHIAAGLCHTEAATLTGLRLLQAQGQIVIEQHTPELISLRRGSEKTGDTAIITRQLAASLQETVSFRRLWHHADYRLPVEGIPAPPLDQ